MLVSYHYDCGLRGRHGLERRSHGDWHGLRTTPQTVQAIATENEQKNGQGYQDGRHGIVGFPLYSHRRRAIHRLGAAVFESLQLASEEAEDARHTDFVTRHIPFSLATSFIPGASLRLAVGGGERQEIVSVVVGNTAPRLADGEAQVFLRDCVAVGQPPVGETVPCARFIFDIDLLWRTDPQRVVFFVPTRASEADEVQRVGLKVDEILSIIGEVSIGRELTDRYSIDFGLEPDALLRRMVDNGVDAYGLAGAEVEAEVYGLVTPQSS